MALIRSCLSLVFAVGGLVACAPAPVTTADQERVLHFKDAPFKSDLETVVIMTPRDSETHELWQALSEELTMDFNVATVPIDGSTGPAQMAIELERLKPQCAVVVDNRTLNLYRSLQRSRPQQAFPPAIVVMSSYLGRAMPGLRSATGIAYEVPAVTSLAALREVAAHAVNKVGVVHRGSFKGFVDAQAQLMAVEKVQLVNAGVGEEPTAADVEDALDWLVEHEDVDALWVLNDNKLLTPELIASSWLPVLNFQPLPVLVGVEALVRADVHFGTVAVTPDHPRLGVQVADMVFELADNDWRLEEQGRVELPLSVRTVADVAQLEEHFQLRPEALANVDEVVK